MQHFPQPLGHWNPLAVAALAHLASMLAKAPPSDMPYAHRESAAAQITRVIATITMLGERRLRENPSMIIQIGSLYTY